MMNWLSIFFFFFFFGGGGGEGRGGAIRPNTFILNLSASISEQTTLYLPTISSGNIL